MSRDPLFDQLEDYAEALVSDLPTAEVRSEKLVEPKRNSRRGWVVGLATAAAILLPVLVFWLLSSGAEEEIDPVDQPPETLSAPSTIGPTTTSSMPEPPEAVASLVDPESWSVSPIGVRDAADYSISNLIAHEQGFATLAHREDGLVELLNSANGVEWTTLGQIEGINSWRGFSLVRIDDVWVVGSGSKLWTSTDATSWREISIDLTDPDGFEVTPAGLVIGDWSGGTILMTDDGQAFEAHRLDDVDGQWGIVPTDDGFLVYGVSDSSTADEQTEVVWRYSDGEWRREETNLPYADPNDLVRPFIDVHRTPFGYFAVLHPRDDMGRHEDEFWFSEDGLNWSTKSTRPDGFWGRAASNDVAVATPGSSLVWITTDGINWYEVPDDPASDAVTSIDQGALSSVRSSVAEVALSDNRIVVVGADRLEDQSPRRLVAWSAELD